MVTKSLQYGLMLLFVFLAVSITIWFLQPITHQAASVAKAENLPLSTSDQQKIEYIVPKQSRMLLNNPVSSPSMSLATASNRSVLLGEEVPTHPVIEQFRSIYHQFQTAYIQPGWLHFAYRIEHPVQPNANQSGDITLPSTFILDTWYHLNQNLQVIEGVSQIFDEHGNVIQVSVYRDNLWYNVTLKESFPVDQPPTLTLDWLFSDTLEYVLLMDGAITAETITQVSGMYTKFEATESLTPPQFLNTYGTTVAFAKNCVYIDAETNKLLVYERIFTTTEGVEFIGLREFLQVIENTEPPTDILVLLENINK